MKAIVVLGLLSILSCGAIADDFESPDDESDPYTYTGKLKQDKDLADFGDMFAQFDLAVAFEFGKGIPQDLERAVKWYRRSAEQGLMEAQSRVGVMYQQGKGTPVDFEQAAYWYEKAAIQGDPMAQNNLGGLHYKGRGVQQDAVRALCWWIIASVQGSRVASRNMEMAKSETSPEQIALAYDLAVSWWQSGRARSY